MDTVLRESKFIQDTEICYLQVVIVINANRKRNQACIREKLVINLHANALQCTIHTFVVGGGCLPASCCTHSIRLLHLKPNKNPQNSSQAASRQKISLSFFSVCLSYLRKFPLYRPCTRLNHSTALPVRLPK